MKTIYTFIVSITLIFSSILGSGSVQPRSLLYDDESVYSESVDCLANTGWQWVNGPDQPQVAEQIQTGLLRSNIPAVVKAIGYGEVDLCDQYFPRGVDLVITLEHNTYSEQSAQENLLSTIQAILKDIPGINFGNIQVVLPQGKMINLRLPDPLAVPDQDQVFSWQQVMTAQAPSARRASGMAFDHERAKMVLFGGDDTGYSRLNDTWEYDGINWEFKNTVHAPDGRVNIDQGMTYDTWRNVTVLFGGLGSSQYLSDTWEYNGVDWSRIYTSQNPTERDAHAMAFDNYRGKTVLFGGYSSGPTDDTWEYDGEWHSINLSVKPTERFGHAMAYDQRRNVVVIFGGRNYSGDLNDTWEYDGIQWIRINTPRSPSARTNISMTYDASRGTVLLFGGSSDGIILNDTWEYNGTNWVQISTSQTPAPREEMSLVFDAHRNKTVLFGGGDWLIDYHPYNETWEYPFVASIDGLVINKKVYVIAYNPFVDPEKTTRLWDYLGWNSYEDITNGTIEFFRENSGGQVRYNVVDTTILDEIPEKTDGFTYTIQGYLDVIHQISPPHNPDNVNYNIIVNDSRLDICGKANRGEIDEVWIFQGPNYGFWESTLVGPGSYWYNSPPVPGPFTCNRMIPIMGPSSERYISEHVEDFGHRTESTMALVYNYEWEHNHTRNGWEKFTLVDSLSPDYTFSGCGNIHFPPNGQSDYDWWNPQSAQTYCNDFANYPDLQDPSQVLETVTCSTWNCDSLTYFDWWYEHLPSNPGCGGTDQVANNWWLYFAYPELALSPNQACALNYNHKISLPMIVR